MKTIDCQVVMLPQNKKGWSRNDIVKTDSIIAFPLHDMDSNIDNWKAQHLYFTHLINAPRKGDYAIRKYDNTVVFIATEEKAMGASAHSPSHFQIIASTDPSLGLPSIPKSFIQQYVASNGKINKVSLTIKEFPDSSFGNDRGNVYWKLKLTDKNEVVIVEFRPKMTKDCQAWYGRGGYDCHTPCDCPLIPIEPQDTRILDNILPQIANGTFNINQTLEDAANHFADLYDVSSMGTRHLDYWSRPIVIKAVKHGANWQKKQSATDAVPTDEEIEKKANSRYKIDEDQSMKSERNGSVVRCREGYIDGYNQALKDLGYE